MVSLKKSKKPVQHFDSTSCTKEHSLSSDVAIKASSRTLQGTHSGKMLATCGYTFMYRKVVIIQVLKFKPPTFLHLGLCSKNTVGMRHGRRTFLFCGRSMFCLGVFLLIVFHHLKTNDYLTRNNAFRLDCWYHILGGEMNTDLDFVTNLCINLMKKNSW